MSAAAAASSAAALANRRHQYNNISSTTTTASGNFQYYNSLIQPTFNKYNYQKRRDWNIFRQFLRNLSPQLHLSRCSGAHVVEFLRHLDQFGKTKIHCENCRFFGESKSQSLVIIRSCPCPLKQSWGNLDAMVSRLRAAFYEENGGNSLEMNPFGSHVVKLYLDEVRDEQATAMGIIITY